MVPDIEATRLRPTSKQLRESFDLVNITIAKNHSLKIRSCLKGFRLYKKTRIIQVLTPWHLWSQFYVYVNTHEYFYHVRGQCERLELHCSCLSSQKIPGVFLVAQTLLVRRDIALRVVF